MIREADPTLPIAEAVQLLRRWFVESKGTENVQGNCGHCVCVCVGHQNAMFV